MSRVLNYNATVVRRTEIAEGLCVFQVALDGQLEPKTDLKYPFSPGQYVTIGLNRSTNDPADTRPLSVLRPMTIASAPEQTDRLEFYVQFVEKPDSRLPLTHLMWPLREGDRLYVRSSATGRFTEQDTIGPEDKRHRILVASGTGIAPFISMLRSKTASQPNASLKKYLLLDGVYNPSCLSYRGEIEEWVKKNELVYIPTMSRPHQSSEWSGHLGRVDTLLSPDEIENTEALGNCRIHPDEAVVFVCGLGDILSGTIKNLLRRGFVPEHRRLRKLLDLTDKSPSLFYEQYDAEPLFDFKNEEAIKELKMLCTRSRTSSNRSEISSDINPPFESPSSRQLIKSEPTP